MLELLARELTEAAEGRRPALRLLLLVTGGGLRVEHAQRGGGKAWTIVRAGLVLQHLAVDERIPGRVCGCEFAN